MDLYPNLSSVPVFLIIFLVASDIALVIFLIIAVALLEIMLLPCFTELYSPKTIASISLNETNQVEFQFNSEILGVVEEATVIGKYRYMQVLNCHTNTVYSCISLACHHALLLVTVVFFAYISIRAWDILTSLGVFGCILLAFLLTVVFICLLIEYIECIQLGQIASATSQFKETGKSTAPGKTYFGKFIKSCPNYLTMRIADPFFLITKETFIQFMNQVLDLLVALLAM